MADNDIDRRTLLASVAATSAGLMLPASAQAAARKADLAAIRKAAEAAKDASVARLQDWIRHPGIAAEKWRIDESCDFTMGLLKDAGFQMVKKMPTDGSPGIFATLDAGAKRSVGVYFMYDVKQVNPAEWAHPPFEAHIIDKPGFGKCVTGRGAVNQKGPEATFLAALHAFHAAGRKLPVNLVLVAEGEEEIASPHFHQIVQNPEVTAALKKCDGIFIPSASQSLNGAVEIELGAKGPLEFQLISSGEHWGRGPKGDVHSSLHAMVDSPVWRLVQALNTLVGPDGHTPAIDGWFDNVRPLTAREKALIIEASTKHSEKELKEAVGIKTWINDEPWPVALQRLAGQPTVNIQGLVAGYMGPGGKTVLPGRAEAKLECRLVPNQTFKEAEAKLRAHLIKRGFGDIEVNVSGGYDPTETAEDSRLIRAEKAVYARMGADVAISPRSPGSWPGSVFTQPPVAIPAGQFGPGYGSGAHAPNEFFVIESTNAKVLGMVDSMVAYADMLYEMAVIS
ncbi:MAG: twin-arginine translocation pathway signal protein [Sphingomonas sp. 28-62-20]|uniref:M20/M25/M40 family metallo-hydrolase n=1 Tax=Sphingomonas sp. 28-62-20 TaxID=1970433 RepID=UPI000BD93F60|nr:MAG: twin-arginine translocation pathway signal protein [Sphingomonas sp. 28-62-20]